MTNAILNQYVIISSRARLGLASVPSGFDPQQLAIIRRGEASQPRKNRITHNRHDWRPFRVGHQLERGAITLMLLTMTLFGCGLRKKLAENFGMPCRTQGKSTSGIRLRSFSTFISALPSSAHNDNNTRGATELGFIAGFQTAEFVETDWEIADPGSCPFSRCLRACSRRRICCVLLHGTFTWDENV